MTKQEMINAYNEMAYTHDYIIGVKVKGEWFACFLENATDLLDKIIVETRESSSHGGGASIRFMPVKATREIVIANAVKVEPICSVVEMDNLFHNSKENRGNIFEYLVAEKFNGVLNKKKNAKFTEGGDLEIDGKAYQCKIEKATWTTEKTLVNLASFK